jgi:hypothetical protein
MVSTYQRPTVQLHPTGSDIQVGSVPGTLGLLALPRVVATLAMGCRGFETLEVHAQRLCEELKVPAEQQPNIMAALRELADKGLLSSGQELLDRLRNQPVSSAAASSEDHQPFIAWLGMITRNRPQAALRCIRSFGQHFRTHGRRVRMTVVDSSDQSAGAGELQAALGLTARELGTEIHWIGPADKARLAADLARAADVDPALLSFALLGDELSTYDVGANRNALLLAQAGEAFLSTDDDMECFPRRAAGPTVPLRLASAGPPTQLFLHPNYQTAHDSLVPLEGDLLNMHERVLGRTAGFCVRDVEGHEIQLGSLDAEMMASLLQGRAQVRASFGGYYGDAGASYPSFYLWSESVRRQLLEGPDQYSRLVTSRQVVRLAPALTVSNGSFSMCGSVALDARELLPPFFPIMRGEDLAFGSTLRSCYPDALFAYVPHAVAHRPWDDRLASMARLWNPEPRAQFAFVLDQLLEVAADASRFSAPGERRLRLTGRCLREIAALSVANFLRLLSDRVMSARAGSMARLQSLLDLAAGAPDYWANDLRRYLKHQLESLVSPERGIPEELGNLQPGEAVACLQRLVDRYGALLEVWPEIFAAARTLAEQRR